MKRRRGPDRHEPGLHRLDSAPSDPGAAAARSRVEALLEQMTRVELQVVVVSPPDETRLAAEDHARDAALVAGRDTLLRDAVAAARDATIRLFARGGFSGTWAATDMAVSVVRASDRVAAAAAVEEAAIAAVVEDLVDDETLEILRSTWDDLVSLRRIPAPGSLSAFAAPVAVTLRGPLQVAIVGASAIALVVGALALGSVPGAIVAAAGIALVAGLARRLRQPYT